MPKEIAHPVRARIDLGINTRKKGDFTTGYKVSVHEEKKDPTRRKRLEKGSQMVG